MDERLEVPKLSSAALKKRLLKGVPEMPQIADGDVHVLFNTDSCQMGIEHWMTLASHIRSQSKHYHGVVILHGTDTLAYSAAALSFLLAPSPIPVVFTGAQRPLSSIRNDARTNLLTALEVAACCPKPLQNRIMVAFHDEVFLGSRVRKLSALGFAAFESPRFPRLARVGSTIQYESIIHHLPKIQSKKPLIDSINTPSEHAPLMLKAEVTPGFPSPLFYESTLKHLDGILLTLYASGTAPTEEPDFMRFLNEAKKQHCPILAITERHEAPVNLSSYASGKTLEKSGVIWCKDLTPEAAWVKAMLIHYQNRTRITDKKRRTELLQKQFQKALSDETH